MLAPRKKLWSAPVEVIDAAINMLAVSPEDTLADYGCGDGRVLIRAASTIGCHCLGVEMHVPRADAARAAVSSQGLSELVEIQAANALDVDFSKANKVFLFLIDRGLRMIMPLIRAASARSRASGSDHRPVHVVTALYKWTTGAKHDVDTEAAESEEEIPPPVKVEWVTINEMTKYPLYVYEF